MFYIMKWKERKTLKFQVTTLGKFDGVGWCLRRNPVQITLQDWYL